MSSKSYRTNTGRAQNVPQPTTDFAAALEDLGIPETQDDLLRSLYFTLGALLSEVRTIRQHLEIINDEELEVCDAD